LASRAALGSRLDLWRRRRELAAALTTGDAIRAASTFRGCDLWDVVAPQLHEVAMLQWPWSARAMDEAAAALDSLLPRAAVTYAEAGGWGRALILECRRRGVPSIGLQHGFIYRHWLNYRHEPDEIEPLGTDRGCPIPDRTLLFDRFAEQYLLEAGHFPAGALRVTGNARLDDLAAQVALLRPGRSAVRAELEIGAQESMALLAAKYSEVRAQLPELVAVVRERPDMRLIIKPHPAETPELYQPAIAGAANVAIAGAGTDLARLLTAADAIVTRNSTVAIDGLALGLPALVLGLPNNLSPFVDAGAMAGATGMDEIRARLHALLYDGTARRALIEAGAAFARRFQIGSDGHAARRAADEILAMAAHPAGKRNQ
jgi:hypothetical protein